jgi:hypothetical protein
VDYLVSEMLDVLIIMIMVSAPFRMFIIQDYDVSASDASIINKQRSFEDVLRFDSQSIESRNLAFVYIILS